MSLRRRYGPGADRALDLWVKLARASASFHRCADENIRSFGLTGPQFSVLETLGHLGPLLTGVVTEKQLVSGGNTTVVVNNLARRGLVRRSVCKSDGRAKYLELTPAGRRLFDRIFPRHASFIERRASVLTTEEQKRLASLLKKLGKGVQTWHSNNRTKNQ